MSEWKSLHAFSTAVDPMLIEVVGPFFEQHAKTLDHGFWERHYAGGPHVRIRLRAPAAELDERLAGLRRELEAWMERHPAPSVEGYSEDLAARVLRKEGFDIEAEDLTYRNGVVLDRPYPERNFFLSPAARELAENFRRDRGPLALRLLRDSAQSRHESALKLYFTLALYVGAGRYPPGSVSFKSHWEHFAATLSSDELRSRIQESYLQRRPRVLALLEEVKRGWENGFAGDPILRDWWLLLENTYEQAAGILRKGSQLTYHPTSREEIVAGRERLYESFAQQSNEFVRTMWENDEFAALVQYDLPFQLSRALVNLLYDVIASLGMRPLDKLAFCYCTFRAVEDACRCDLNDFLRSNMTAVVQRQAHRLSADAKAV